MLTMAVGQSDDVDSSVAVAEAIQQCRDQLDGRIPAAGILFIAFDSFDPALSETVRAAFPGIELIGSTSGGGDVFGVRLHGRLRCPGSLCVG